jgi:hypothetical protein
MICDSKLKYAVSNLGWIDKGSLWIYNSSEDNFKTFFLSDSKYLSIFEGSDDYFAICHNYENSLFEISIHHFSQPDKILCKLTIDNSKTDINGDVDLIKYIPNYYVAGFTLNGEYKTHLISIQDKTIKIDDSKIEWFNNGNFDFGYQGLLSVTEYNDELLFCVQRDGRIYRVNKESNQLVSKINLAMQFGNPKITFNRDKSILITDDYDILLNINPLNWKIEKHVKFQVGFNGASQFIGSYNFNKMNNLITLARPFSSDVIMIDKNFSIKYYCKIGRQPLESVVLDKNRVIARDWKTGDLLIGKMKHKFFFHQD